MERYKIIENPFGEIVLMGVPGSFENKTDLKDFVDDLAEAVGAFNLRCCIGGSVWKHHPEHAEEILEWKKNGTGPMPKLEEFKMITDTQALNILGWIPKFSDAVDILRGASADVLNDKNLMNALVDDIVDATRPELGVYVIDIRYENRTLTVYAASRSADEAVDMAFEYLGHEPAEPTVTVEKIWNCEYPGVIHVKVR